MFVLFHTPWQVGYLEEIGSQVSKRGVDFTLDVTGREHAQLQKYTRAE